MEHKHEDTIINKAIAQLDRLLDSDIQAENTEGVNVLSAKSDLEFLQVRIQQWKSLLQTGKHNPRGFDGYYFWDVDWY